MRARHLLLASAALIGALGCGGERTPIPKLPAARAALAEPAALPRWRRAAIDLVLRARVWQGARSGFVALVARDGRLVHAVTTGQANREADVPMTMDTRFQIASMTKPITATAAMILVEEGRLGLDEPIAKYLPELAAMQVAVLDDAGTLLDTRPPSQPITIRHLLSFRSGMGGSGFEETSLGARWRDDGLYRGEGTLAERVGRFAALPLFEDPGTRWRYGVSHDVLARIIEIAAGEPLDLFMQRRIFDPLGMHATSYAKDVPPDAPLARLYTQDAEGDLVPAPGPVFKAADWTPGGSGIVSTAPDYMRFALMLWNEGEYDGARILTPETVRAMRHLEVPSGVLANFGIEGLGFGLGVSVVADDEAATMSARDGDFWWSGVFGTHFWVSPSTGIVLVVLQQNQTNEWSGRPIAPFLVQALALVD